MDSAASAALITGVCWGVGTYALGKAALKVSPPLLTALFNIASFIIFGSLFALSNEVNTIADSTNTSEIILKAIGAGLVGGVCFSVGLTVIGVAISKGRAGIVGPVASTWEVILPCIYALVASQLPKRYALVGIAILLCVPWLVTRTNSDPQGFTTTIGRDVMLASIAGAGFGGYYIGLLIGPKSASLLTMTIIMASSATIMLAAHAKSKRQWSVPRETLHFAAIFIVLEIIGAFLIRYALRNGSPAVVSTIASIFYVAILLAISYILNHEKFSKMQLVGFAGTAIGIAMVVLNS